MGQVTKLGLSCYLVWHQLIAKPGDKTATVSWPDPYVKDDQFALVHGEAKYLKYNFDIKNLPVNEKKQFYI